MPGARAGATADQCLLRCGGGGALKEGFMTAVSIPTPGVKASSETTFLRIAAICAIAAQVAFVALWIVWGFLEDHYDVTRQDISDFGALDATHPLAYNIIL